MSVFLSHTHTHTYERVSMSLSLYHKWMVVRQVSGEDPVCLPCQWPTRVVHLFHGDIRVGFGMGLEIEPQTRGPEQLSWKCVGLTILRDAALRAQSSSEPRVERIFPWS